ncbi:MAG: carbon-nitrogen hydrolase family protein [Saprospiraceae bacterium]|nr:carbon-nitrogen hydrolase family protein [Lewinella sp.]
MKVAVVQAGSILFNTPATLEKMKRLIAEASAGGARLILFPEAFIGGYPRGLGFGTVVGSRSPHGREQWLDYYRSAVEIPGPEIAAIGSWAKQHKVYIAAGVIERSGGTLYCTLAYWGPDGNLLHYHRKLKPTASERLIWGEGQGKDLQVLDTELGKVGGLICWENYMPLARMAFYEQQVELYLAPTADQRDTWLPSMQHIACEGRCFVLTCNQFVNKTMYPADYQSEIEGLSDIVSRGGSAIVDPLGTVIAGPIWDQERIVAADIDLKAIAKGKFDFDVTGHYARPDVFNFDWKMKADH